MRLQKFMAKCGVASRRKCEQLISDGYVTVNDKKVIEQGVKIDPAKDVVVVNGKVISLEDRKVYILLNKPEGYVTTVSDQFNRPTVLDLIDKLEERIFPVGRLDYDTSGLLLLTNDGQLTYKLTHPKHEIRKVYLAVVKGIPTDKELYQFKKGLQIDNYITAKSDIKVVEVYKDKSLVEIVIHEGKNRQVRKMCAKINHPVLSLKRVAMGEIRLEEEPKGYWRHLKKHEIEYLKKI